MALLAAIVACLVICLVHAFHPPAVALALYPVLFHPGNCSRWLLYFPFTVIAVCSALLLRTLIDKWPAYPKPLQGVTPAVKRFGEYGLDLDCELEPPIQQMLSRRKVHPGKPRPNRGVGEVGLIVMERLIKTALGDARAAALEELQTSFDTRQIPGSPTSRRFAVEG